MPGSRLFLKTVKYSFVTTAVVSVGSAVALNHRLSLDTFREANLTAEYYRTRSVSSLCSSLFVYTISSSPILVSLGKASIKACDGLGVPVLYEILARRTFFQQFCGGETCSQVQDTMRRLRRDKLGVILAYAKEEQGSTEAGFERVRQDMLATIDVASGLPNNFVALKLTALADPQSIKAHSAFLKAAGSARQYDLRLSPEDQQQIVNLQERLETILDHCAEKKVKVLIDAEQDRYQATIEDLTMQASRKYNKKEAVAYGTYQCYLKHTLARVKTELKTAQDEGFYLGVKLVRGAYITSEPRHLIHDTKADSDESYNDAVRYLLPSRNVETFIATHNAESLNLAMSMLPSTSPTAFAQLYGMSSALTYSLLRQLEAMPRSEAMEQGGGIRVYSYVPWGTVSESMKYLLRRADENSSMIPRGKAERDEIFLELLRRVKGKMTMS